MSIEQTRIDIRTEKSVAKSYKKSYVVSLTSNNSSTARQTYFEDGIDAFILKPINLSELDNVLNKLLAKEESNQNKKADEYDVNPK